MRKKDGFVTKEEFLASIYIAGEEWRDVKGYDGIYMVSSYGRVISLPRYQIVQTKKCGGGEYRRYINPKCLIGEDDFGYLRVHLSINGKNKRRFFIHRLVADAFLPNPLNLPYINHKDEIKTNNHVENLEWCTRIYNQNYGTIKERMVSSRWDSDNYHGKPVAMLDDDGNVIKAFRCLREAAEYANRGISAIYFAVKHKTNCIKHKWRYLDIG